MNGIDGLEAAATSRYVTARALDPNRATLEGYIEKDLALVAAEDFEALFLTLLLKQMRAGTLKGGIFGESNAAKIFESLFHEEIANIIAHSRPGTGLSDVIYKDIASSGELKEGAGIADKLNAYRAEGYAVLAASSAGTLLREG